ncbi:hypothetical protein IFM89_031931 [Coptis chinensis]|uniref:F-box associated beta-propeller type 3 domain-containing protein n=1 Tax=Coptis chinensis TaxID=261450 RepID=A0A835ITT0_9MAGN|nr:hypothetical protein IFM89_031931 [Coptis chinensis]
MYSILQRFVVFTLELITIYKQVRNPVTPETIILPKPRCLEKSWTSLMIGFGVDTQLTGKYKVVSWTLPILSHEVEVLTLGTDSWRRIRVEKTNFVPYTGPPAYANGALHWHFKEYVDGNR